MAITIQSPQPLDPETESRLVSAVSNALGVPPAEVAVTQHAAQPGRAALVHDFLTAMEARDLPRAQAMLAPDFEMTFPGGRRMRTLPELIAWAAPRYRFVRKTYDRFDAAGDVVYCFGTLSGEWPDGTPFAGIRFIDRFEMAGGLIVRQDVWNDIAEVKPA